MRLAQNTGNCQNITAKILNMLGDISGRLIKIKQKKKKKKNGNVKKLILLLESCLQK